jgi:hypothetical protein
MMNLKKVAVTIGIAILTALFIGFFLEAAYPTPDYMQYCKNAQSMYSYNEKLSPLQCNTSSSYSGFNKDESKNCMNQNGTYIVSDYDDNGCPIKYFCNVCDRDYMNVMEKHELNTFYITAPIGLILIVLGLFLPLTMDAVAAGLLLGGILTLLQATVRAFGNLGKWNRVIVLGVELAILLLIGWKKTLDAKKK